MKKMFLFSALLLLSGIIYSQTTKTVGIGGNYATLKLAFDAINAGTITGDITLNIISDITDNNSAVLNASGTGSSSYTSVLVQPTGTPPSGMWTLTANIDEAIIDLDGAQNVTINGQLDGMSWAQNLFLVNKGATYLGWGIEFRENAIYNTVEYCHLECNNASTTGAIDFGVPLSSSQGNCHNLIDHCNITHSKSGVLNLGISSVNAWNTNNIIKNCEIYDWRVAGIDLSPNCGRAWVIGGSGEVGGGNHFYQTSSFSAPDVHYAIMVNGGDSIAIMGNYIGGSSPYCNGPAWTNTNTTHPSYAIYVSGGTIADSCFIQSNRILNMNLSGTGFTGIEVNEPVMFISGNNVGGNGSSDEIKMTGTGNLTGIHAWADAGSPDFHIFNNMIQLLTINNTSNSQAVTGISVSSTVNGTLMDIGNNTIQQIHSNGNSSAIAVRGIGVTANYATFTLSSNIINGLISSNGGSYDSKVKGITLDADYSSITLSKNQITEMSNNCTGSSGKPEIVGIQVYYENGIITASNNMISITNGENSNDINIYGIRDQGISGTGFGTHSYYYNSVYIGGSTIGYTTSACFRRDADFVSTLVNNIFFNDRFSIVPQNNLAVILNSNNSTLLSSNHNDLYTKDVNYVCSADGGTTALSLTNWQIAFTPNTDLASHNVYPGFNSQTDLRINANAYLNKTGDPSTGITDDIDGYLRNALTPDPGINEFPYTSYTVGIGGHFISLKHAFDRINDGTIQGNIQLAVISNIGNDSIASLNASGTGSPPSYYSMVLVQPAGTLVPPTSSYWSLYSMSLTGPMIILNGTSNVIFEGRIQGATSGSNLVLENHDIYNDAGEVLRYQNGANSNTIKHCVIKANNLGAHGAIFFWGSGPSTTGNSYNTIDSCEIRPSSHGLRNAIYCDSSEHFNTWNIIRNCNIHNFLDNGILISRPTFAGEGWVDFGNDSWWITGNSFYRDDSSIPDGGTAIECQKGNSHHILNNFIGGTEPLAMGGSSSISRGIKVMGTYYTYPSQPDYIEGNTIRRICSSQFNGMYVVDQNVDIGSTEGNKIGDSLLANAVWCRGAGAYGMYILNHLDHQVNIRNNMIANVVDSAFADGDALVGIGTMRNGTDSYLGSNGEISGNRIFELKDMSAGYRYHESFFYPAHPKVYGILVKGNYLTVRNNKIYKTGVLVPYFSGTTDTVVGILTDTHPGSVTDSCMISDNMVSLGYYTSTCLRESLIGIMETSVGQGHNNFYFNSVYIKEGGAYNQYSTYGFLQKSFSSNILNNLFVNNRSSGGMPGDRGNYAIGVCDVVGLNSNHNDLYSATPTRVATAHCGYEPMSLAAWQSLYAHPKDLNSVSVFPTFISETDLHCSGPAILDNLGICIPGYQEDIEGNPRQNPPDPGINEFTSKSYKTWLGEASPFWDQAMNWNPAGVPTTLDNVRLTPGINYSPTIRYDGATCLDLLIDAGVTLTVNPGKFVEIMGVLVLVKYCP